jgi:hypothetical protein
MLPVVFLWLHELRQKLSDTDLQRSPPIRLTDLDEYVRSCNEPDIFVIGVLGMDGSDAWIDVPVNGRPTSYPQEWPVSGGGQDDLLDPIRKPLASEPKN